MNNQNSDVQKSFAWNETLLLQYPFFSFTSTVTLTVSTCYLSFCETVDK